MGFTQPPSRSRGRARPVPAVSAGVRKRGRAGKLTPYIKITEPTITSSWFAGETYLGQDSIPMLFLLGEGADTGKVAIMRCSPDKANISLRRESKGSSDFVIETTMIPWSGSKKIDRTGVLYETTDHGMVIALPWQVKKGEL